MWNMYLLNVTLYLDHAHTARIHLGMLFQILQFSVNEHYTILTSVSTKQHQRQETVWKPVSPQLQNTEHSSVVFIPVAMKIS